MAYTEQYEIDFSVSITPKIKQLQSGDTQSSSDLYYIDDEIGKTLGGSGKSGGAADGDGTTLTASGDDVTGWASGSPTYVISMGEGGKANDVQNNYSTGFGAYNGGGRGHVGTHSGTGGGGGY